MYNSVYLAHHGVKGMKWGIKKEKKRLQHEINSLDKQISNLKGRYIKADYKNKKLANKIFSRIDKPFKRNGTVLLNDKKINKYQAKRDALNLEITALNKQIRSLQKKQSALVNETISKNYSVKVQDVIRITTDGNKKILPGLKSLEQKKYGSSYSATAIQSRGKALEVLQTPSIIVGKKYKIG